MGAATVATIVGASVSSFVAIVGWLLARLISQNDKASERRWSEANKAVEAIGRQLDTHLVNASQETRRMYGKLEQNTISITRLESRRNMRDMARDLRDVRDHTENDRGEDDYNAG